MTKVLDALREFVRSIMRSVAKGLNKITLGKLSPNFITLFGFAMHIPIAYLIAVEKNIPAAILLVVFGLFDTLDGELARLQKRASPAGMLLDASADRMKEVILYTGIAYNFIHTDQTNFVIWVILACGGSLIVSYVKAKGETAIASTNLSHAETNRMFQDGLMRFEVRMFALVVGLVFDQLAIVVVIIAVLSWFTAFQRLILITNKIK